ncbi:MAG: RNA polymerase sporulation sigma factor SigH [Clostridia bacterium]|jgi:RNA polymerase sporulation-specific sigma factor|nr:RNA polymerase sporulation sigma factor SigH [Clostridia bacterium]
MSKANVYYSSNTDYTNMTDEDLITLIKSEDKCALEHLINRYKNIVSLKIGKYYMIGAEKEDIEQEGLIGLFKAIKSYQPEKQNSFKTFANMCIERQLITAIKSSNRQKHMPLNSYLSLNMNAYDNEEDGNNSTIDLLGVLDTKNTEDPLDTITQKEYYELIETTIDKTLSDFEKKVLNQYMQGESYVQIAQKLDTPVKSIDNAIQRIRKKAIKEMQDKQD